MQLQLTNHLSTLKGWMAELTWLADVQRTVYPQKWSPVCCIGRAQDGKVRQSLKDRRSTTLPRNEPTSRRPWRQCQTDLEIVARLHLSLHSVQLVGVHRLDLAYRLRHLVLPEVAALGRRVAVRKRRQLLHLLQCTPANFHHSTAYSPITKTRSLAIANRSRDNCAHKVTTTEMTVKTQSRSSEMSQFLLLFHSNYGPILHRFPHIPRYWSKIAKFMKIFIHHTMVAMWSKEIKRKRKNLTIA